jgi:dual specificity tyrosine-phosphorylation-regulated kinase 2/3/4
LRVRLGCDDEDFLHFVASLLVLDPEKRPTAAQALKHPWLQKEYDLEPYILPG